MTSPKIYNLWPSTGKPDTTRHPSKKIFLQLQICWLPDIELSKFYRRSLSRSHYNRPNCSLPSAWNNTFLRNWSIFSQYLRTPRCARFSCRQSHLHTHTHTHTHIHTHTYTHTHWWRLLYNGWSVCICLKKIQSSSMSLLMMNSTVILISHQQMFTPSKSTSNSTHENY